MKTVKVGLESKVEVINVPHKTTYSFKQLKL